VNILSILIISAIITIVVFYYLSLFISLQVGRKKKKNDFINQLNIVYGLLRYAYKALISLSKKYQKLK